MIILCATPKGMIVAEGQKQAIMHMMPTILIVDDEPDIGEVISFALQRAGYETQLASNGEEALQRLTQSPTALVVTDYMMPVKDGYELVMAIRASKLLMATPVLMVSALPEDVVRKKCPVDAFLQKPLKADHLLNTVRDLLAKRRLGGGPR